MYSKDSIPAMVDSSGDSPPGLDCLILTNQLQIMEERDAGPITRKSFKRYHIFDALDNHLFFCTETKRLTRTDCWCYKRKDYTAIRPWTIEALNEEYQENSIMTGNRSRMKTSCCLVKQSTKISSFGQILGRIDQEIKLYKDESTLIIVDAKGTPVIQIKAHQYLGGLFSTKRCHEFPMMNMDNKQCGKITWCSDSVWEPSSFGVEFSADLDVKIKALLIYATIMIEFSYVQAVRQHHRSK